MRWHEPIYNSFSVCCFIDFMRSFEKLQSSFYIQRVDLLHIGLQIQRMQGGEIKNKFHQTEQ